MACSLAAQCVCATFAGATSVLAQSASLEAQLGSRRVQHMCTQLAGLFSLLVSMQSLHSSTGLSLPRESMCMAEGFVEIRSCL